MEGNTKKIDLYVFFKDVAFIGEISKDNEKGW
jgi:hypothetical protein